eukprot:208652-Pleurochrysis_carterae.AAC.1
MASARAGAMAPTTAWAVTLATARWTAPARSVYASPHTVPPSGRWAGVGSARRRRLETGKVAARG